ncbi:MAG: GYD domain-containing protein [Alphaproteobacteria bacterium]|nr:GYD domain-containing protein [Alphaproteobacteria bacterium]
MAYYLFTGSYTTDAIKTMVANPQDREAAARAAAEAVGAKLHSFFFTFGQSDVIAIIEADDDIAMSAISLTVGASGSVAHGATTKLLTAAEAMAAMARAKDATGSYSPPGS